METTSFIYTSQPEWGEFSSQVISLFAITLTCSLFGVKTFQIKYRQLTYARWLVVALYICSWAFTTTATILVSTANGNYTSCFLSIMTCDLFYCGTKLIIYLWLIERAYIVSDGRNARFDTWSYRFNLFLMTPYIGIFVLMLVYHNSIMTSTGQCYIGLQPIANIPVLVYDTIFNLYMTILFVIPLIRVGRGVNSFEWKSSRLFEITKRSLIASTVCLVASFANALSATIMYGRQRSWLCLMCCTIDVTINVLTIHWVTTPTKTHRQHSISGPISFTSADLTTTGGESSNMANDSKRVSVPSSSPTLSAFRHQEQQEQEQQDHSSPYSFSHGNRSSISLQDSQCSTKSLTKSPII
ncbi:uncharacterized protein BX664DRAFT_322130 [Halteromyces radiatus]|uniref:uncharacterized protein n=1 Tax=Halteromyces radiatus TaxID=101107 RepID=UPI0022209DC0|nr:uncharacterized protein BX664DRAFT_322130 [Halteromyces radiatus]KAI8099795.1 hypothetical protein BX664DRAFT_322130 [Halteromyces radiatus]